MHVSRESFNFGQIGKLIVRASNSAPQFLVTRDGKVGIGVSLPAYALDLCGVIHTTEVLINLVGCDYVFEPGYKLPPIEERRERVLSEKHLPGVFPAREMQEGAPMGETLLGILKNVEEHELYLHKLYDLLLKQEEEIQYLKSLLMNCPCQGR